MSRCAIPLVVAVLASLAPQVGFAQRTPLSYSPATAVTPAPLDLRVSMPINKVTQHAPSWSATDIGLASGFLALLWVDASQTRSLARNNWNGYHETNPVLGRQPTEGQINTYTATVAVATVGIAQALPPRTRRWWLGVALALEAYTVYHTTSRLGVSLSVR
ncbi:MAG TPA: hypothetical protein VH439_02240 [Gemmatimonadales bacterium]